MTRRPRSFAAARGYTVMEVMMSLAILGVGASGVMAVQKATLLANTSAKNLATANFIAETWMERLRADAFQWNDPAGVPDLATDTAWLRFATTSPLWIIPPTLTAPLIGGSDADVTGSDTFLTDPAPIAASAFCTQLRLTSYDPNTLPTYRKLIRAEVRVLWARSGRPLDCTTLNPADTVLRNDYGAVYLTSAVQQSTAP
ncbi:MAG: prepilin-type N-terminal cleavage/methylation domain-containing protein [Byssovorax sp.]